MKTRKLFSMLLAICLLLALLPTATLADEYESGWQYSVSDGKATIMHYNGAGGDVEIPATLGGCPVTGIGEQTFACCYALTSVTIPSCVESIGDDAFALPGLWWCSIQFIFPGCAAAFSASRPAVSGWFLPCAAGYMSAGSIFAAYPRKW